MATRTWTESKTFTVIALIQVIIINFYLKRCPIRVILDEDMRIRICAIVEMDPHLPSGQIAREVGVSQPSVLKVLKEAGYIPQKIRSGQILLTRDPHRRLQMCNEFIRRFRVNPTFKRRILWTDKYTFFVDGKRNVQDMRTWSCENPYIQVQTHSQYQQKVNVWCGIIDEHIIGLFFINGNLTSVKYQQLIIEDVGPALRNIFGDGEIVCTQNYY